MHLHCTTDELVESVHTMMTNTADEHEPTHNPITFTNNEQKLEVGAAEPFTAHARVSVVHGTVHNGFLKV